MDSRQLGYDCLEHPIHESMRRDDRKRTGEGVPANARCFTPVGKVTCLPAAFSGKALLFCLVLLWAPSGHADSPIIDVLSISGSAKIDVARQLGEPVHCAETYQGNACQYAGGVEVVFMDGRADWIQFAPEVEIPFEPAALRHIGLRPALPTVRNPFRMHWDGHQGLAVVSMYGSGRYVALFQVHSYTTW